jgi:predicted Zn-dependent protease
VTRRTLAGVAAGLAALAGCAQLKGVPGLGAVADDMQRRGTESAVKVGENVVTAAATGELGKKATFSMEQEFHLGKTVAANVVARLGGRTVPPGDPLPRYLRDVGTVLALAAAEQRGAGDRPYPMRGYRFVVVDTPQVNAVGTPGGFVVVTTGLLRTVRSEDELAGVLAHEIAHVQRGHVMAPVESAREQEHMTSALLAGTDPIVHAFFGKVVTVGTDFVLDKGYGKANELEADAFAARILAGAGYDAQGLGRALGRLQGRSAEGGFFSRHPPAAERVASLSGVARSGVPGAEPSRTARFEAKVRELGKGRPSS